MFAVAQYRVKKIHKNGGYENRDILFSKIEIFHHADFKSERRMYTRIYRSRITLSRENTSMQCLSKSVISVTFGVVHCCP